MKTNLLTAILVLAVLFLVFPLVVFGVNTSVSPSSIGLISGSINQLVNISVRNLNTTDAVHITQVNFSLPSGFAFISSTSLTNATNSTFESSTLTLNWTNNTGLVNNGTDAWFAFNLTSPLNFTNYNITVTTKDSSSVLNSSNVTVVLSPPSVSTNKSFGAAPSTIYLNWTNNYRQNVTIMINSSYGTNENITVLNGTDTTDATGKIYANYSQNNLELTILCQNLKIFANNATGDADPNQYNVPPADSRNYTLYHSRMQCKPGRYWTNSLTIVNQRINAENLTISVMIDIPINTSNSANLPTTGIASFDGQMPVNATTYQSYFFDTSEVTNATGVYVNISWNDSSKNLDLFLVDNATTPNLLAKAISTNGTSESLYSFLPTTPAMYEIRIYGNSTSAVSYTGNLIFTTLDSTNRTLSFEIKNANTITSQTFNINNTGNITLSSISETKNIYWVKRYLSSGTRNFTFITPSAYTSKIKVSLNWTGESNYSFTIYDPNDNVKGISTGRYMNANISGVVQEVYNETVPATDGSWKVEIKNNTNVTDNYNLTIYQYVSSVSDWLVTNYTNMTFVNRTYNNSRDIQMNLTVPNSTMDGLYEGYLRYVASSGALIEIPISVNVTTPMLVVNGTIGSMTYTINENYGVNLTRYYNFSINNTGFYDMPVTITNSSQNLTFGNYKAYFIFNTFSTVPNYSSHNLGLNVTLNSTIPAGLYEGWIYFNATNEIENLSSHPYRNFNLTLKLNLTGNLSVRVTNVVSKYNSNEVNGSLDENVTFKTLVTYINGTNVTSLNISNITYVRIYEPNASYWYPNSSGSLVINKCYLSDPLDAIQTSWYWINGTVPANIPGGIYRVYVGANHSRNSYNYSGEGGNAYLVINNTGLNMSTLNSTSISLSANSTYTFVVNVSNLGPFVASSATIQFNESCSGYSVVVTGATGACSVVSQVTDTFTISPYAYNTSCLVWWTVTAGPSAVTACMANIIGAGPSTNKWFNPYGINVTIIVTAATTTTTAASQTPTPSATTTTIISTTTTTIPITLVNVTATTALITPASPATFNITQSETLKIQSITVAVKNNVSKVSIMFKEGQQPTGSPNITTPEEGLVLKYLEIVPTNITDADVANVTINFQVEKSWVTTNNIDVETIALYRYSNNSWNKLQTNKINETSTYLYFQSTSPGLSIFAIAGQKTKAFPWLTIIIVAAAIVGLILAYLFWPVKGEKKPIIVPQEKKEEVQETWEELKKKWDELIKKKKS